MARPTILAIALLLASTQLSQAETCHEKFVRLLIGGNSDTPSKIMVVTEPKGGAVSKNEFYHLKTGHWMTVMLGPSKARTLAYNNTMYTSSNEGKTWKKIRTMDSEDKRKDLC